MFLHEFVSLGTFQVLANHFAYEFLESSLRRPSQFFLCLGWITKKSFNFGRPKVSRVDPDNYSGFDICGSGSDHSNLIRSLPPPCQPHAQLLGCRIDKIANAILNTRRDNKI